MDSTRDFAERALPHVPRLHRLGLKLTRASSDASDLVQESLCRAWARWSQFEGQQSMGAYLSRTLVNTFISGHRHARVVQVAQARSDLIDHLFAVDKLGAAETPEGTWHTRELSDEVLQALDSLPPHYRRVIELVDLEGLAYQAAADELAVPVGTVMSRLHRARRMLRSQLGTYARQFGLGAELSAAS